MLNTSNEVYLAHWDFFFFCKTKNSLSKVVLSVQRLDLQLIKSSSERGGEGWVERGMAGPGKVWTSVSYVLSLSSERVHTTCTCFNICRYIHASYRDEDRLCEPYLKFTKRLLFQRWDIPVKATIGVWFAQKQFNLIYHTPLHVTAYPATTEFTR